MNLDPLASPSDKNKTIANLCNFDDLVADAEAEDLVALDVIDYLPAYDVGRALDHWIKKVRHGGTISIGGVDIREVAKGLIKQELSVEDANLLLYGSQQVPSAYRKATLTLQSLIKLFTDRGLKIINKRTINYYYHIKAERP